MAGLLTGGIAKIVAGATKSVTYAISLVRPVSAAGSNAWDTGTVTETTYACRGMVSDYTEFQINGKNIQVGDRKILIIANTLATGIVPVPDDHIVAQGETYLIIQVVRDPATATYLCQVRR